MSEIDTTARTLAETVARAASRYPELRYTRLYGAVLRGELPAERRGSRWYVTDHQLEAFLRGRK